MNNGMPQYAKVYPVAERYELESTTGSAITGGRDSHGLYVLKCQETPKPDLCKDGVCKLYSVCGRRTRELV